MTESEKCLKISLEKNKLPQEQTPGREKVVPEPRTGPHGGKLALK